MLGLLLQCQSLRRIPVVCVPLLKEVVRLRIHTHSLLHLGELLARLRHRLSVLSLWLLHIELLDVKYRVSHALVQLGGLGDLRARVSHQWLQ